MHTLFSLMSNVLRLNSGGENMEFSIETFVFTIINLLILYWIFKKLLFKPVTEFMEKRANGIKEMFENAESSKEQAETLKNELKEKLDKAVGDAQSIVEESRIKAEKQYEEILNKAKEDAKKLVEKAHKEIELERKAMIDELKAQIAGIALAAASKVVQKNMDTETNKKLVDKFIDEAGAA